MSFVFSRRDLCYNQVVGEVLEDEPGSVAESLTRVNVLEENDDCANLETEFVGRKARHFKGIENSCWVVCNFFGIFGIDGVDTLVDLDKTRHF